MIPKTQMSLRDTFDRIQVSEAANVVIGSGRVEQIRNVFHALGKRQFRAITAGLVFLLIASIYSFKFLSSGQEVVYASVEQVENELDEILENNAELRGTIENHKGEILAAFSAGVESLKENNYAQAIDQLKSVAEQVELRSVYKSIGYAYEQMGNINEAEINFHKARNVERPSTKQKDVSRKQKSGHDEVEPNDDLFTPTPIGLNKWIKAEIVQDDKDHFQITTPDKSRDIISIKIENRSTTLKPRIGLYNSDKKWLGGSKDYGVTAGQNVEYSFSAAPSTKYFIYVDGLGNLGTYDLIVNPLQAYDKYEPNEDILHAKPISRGKVIEGNIMNKSDVDYYHITTAGNANNLAITLENLSTSLKPRVAVYGEMKQWLGGSKDYGVTSGRNVEYTLTVEPGTKYFIYVDGLGSQGDYRLKVQ